MSNRVTVYGPAGSTYVRTVCLALQEKGVAYQLQQLPMNAHKEEPYLSSRHPFGKVPAFEHDGFALYETQAILRYIDDVFQGEPLQPSDPRRRARMNQIMGIVDAYAWPSIAAGVLWNRLIAPRFGLPVDEAAVEAALPRARLCVREIERLMEDNTFLAGDRVTFADLMVLPIISYFALTAEGRAILEPHPRLRAWVDRMEKRESAAQVLAAA